jgi:hypothetical protein
MVTRMTAPALLAALFCAGAAPVVAQDAELPPQVRQWVAEVQQIQEQLEPVRQEAMQDSALQQQHEELTRAMFEAMVAADTGTEARLERMQQIMVEAAQARQQGDNERVAALAPEAQALQAQLDAAQRQALANPAIDQRVKAYRTALHARMAQIDAASISLIQRMETLDAQIREAIGGGA